MAMDGITQLEWEIARIFGGRDAEILCGDGLLLFEVDGEDVTGRTWATFDDLFVWVHGLKK